jgi:hypothetical protein
MGAPTELGIFVGLVFYRDVAPAALGRGPQQVGLQSEIKIRIKSKKSYFNVTSQTLEKRDVAPSAPVTVSTTVNAPAFV